LAYGNLVTAATDDATGSGRLNGRQVAADTASVVGSATGAVHDSAVEARSCARGDATRQLGLSQSSEGNSDENGLHFDGIMYITREVSRGIFFWVGGFEPSKVWYR